MGDNRRARSGNPIQGESVQEDDSRGHYTNFYRPTSFLQKVLRTVRLYALTLSTDLSPSGHTARRRTAILMVVPEVDRIGGYERQALELSRELTRLDYAVVVLSHGQRNLQEREFKFGFLIRRLRGSGIGLFIRLLGYLILKRNRFDVVHVHGVTGFSLTSARIAALLRLPVCLKPATRGDLSALAASRSLKTRLYRTWLPSIQRWISISEELQREIAATGIGSNRIYGIPNFVDTEKFIKVDISNKHHLRAKFSIKGNPLIYLFLGRLEERKGIDILLRAWNRKPCGLLWIVGYGPDESRVKRTVESERIPSVKFHGATMNPVEFYQAADLFVLPSLKEGFPNVLLEAMSCGLPCIATAIGGVIDILKQNEQGLLVRPGSEEDLSEALNRAAASNSDRDRWSANAIQTAKAYDRRLIVQRYQELYSQMLTRPKGEFETRAYE